MKNILTKIGIRKYRNIKFAGNPGEYSLVIWTERPKSFLVTDMGQIVGDNHAREGWKKEQSLLGFSGDRDGKNSWVSKADHRISGNWLKLVSYNDYVLRVIEEKNDEYMVIASGSFLDEDLGMTYIEGSSVAYKWVDKSEVEELEQ